jgi:hypothetical protein
MAKLTSAGIVILPGRSRRFSPGQAADLEAFVAKGGLLLAEAAWVEDAGTAATQDLLFAAFGARAVGSRWWENLQGKTPTELKAYQDAHHTLAVKMGDGTGAGFQVCFAQGSMLEDRGGRAEAALGDDAGVKGLVYRKGKGTAVLFTDMAWIRNDRIGEHDHAAFLEALAALSGTERGRAALVIREEAPSLAAWLKDKAPAALGAFAVLLALALWSAMPRFGPPLPDPPEARRSLLEHLAACGRFQWRLKDGQPLLQAARRATLARIAQVHPGWSSLAPDALSLRIADHTRLPEERVFRALRYERHSDPQGFAEAIQTLDLIRKQT